MKKHLVLLSASTLAMMGCAGQPAEYVEAFNGMRAAEVRLTHSKTRLEEAQAKVEHQKQVIQEKEAEFKQARSTFDSMYLQAMAGK